MSNEWMMIDKVGDIFYFNNIENISKHLCISKNEVYAIVQHSLKSINEYSPKHKVYIQRLYNDPTKHQRDPKKITFYKGYDKIYPYILNE